MRRREQSGRSTADFAMTPLDPDRKRRDEVYSPLRTGALLANRYRIEHPLGCGGSGEVWRAHDLELDLRVALKVPHGRCSDSDSDDLEALRREVRLAREVASRHVCRVFDFLRFAGLCVMSMEFIEGTTLRTLLERKSPLPYSQMTDIASQLLSGLEAIHAVGLVHCDIKPENVMLTESGRVVVMDFSIARALRERGAEKLHGTPAYIAPEEVLGKPLDTRSDIYSVGVMLAEMIEPRGVRSQAARQRVWRDVRMQPPRLAATPWRSLLMSTIAIDPEARPQSARELERALRRVRRIPRETPAVRKLETYWAFDAGASVLSASLPDDEEGEAPWSLPHPARSGVGRRRSEDENR